MDSETAAQFLLPATGQTIEILPGTTGEAKYVYREIFEDGVYTKHGVQAVRAGKGNVVVDVGANIGMFCMYAASLSADISHGTEPVTYYGVEPLPPVFEVLHRNVGGASGTGGCRNMNVKALLNVALGDQVRADVPFTFFPHMPTNSTLNSEERIRMLQGLIPQYIFEGATQYLVPMRTLSDIMEEHAIDRIDFLKVDVEGAELMVLKGVKEAHWNRIWQVVVEVTDADEEINNGDTVVSMRRVHLITDLLKTHGFVVIAEYDDGSKNHMIYARRM